MKYGSHWLLTSTINNAWIETQCQVSRPVLNQVCDTTDRELLLTHRAHVVLRLQVRRYGYL